MHTQHCGLCCHINKCKILQVAYLGRKLDIFTGVRSSLVKRLNHCCIDEFLSDVQKISEENVKRDDSSIISSLWVLVVGVSLLVSVTLTPFVKKSMADTQSVSVRDAGEKLYGVYCVQCHGVTGAGNGPGATALSKKPTNLTRLGWKPDVLLAFKIRNGNDVMPAWKNILNDDQISYLIEYIRTFKPVD